MSSKTNKEVVVYKTFKDFYPFYLVEHSNATNRQFHFVGTTLAIVVLFYVLLSGDIGKLLYVPMFG